MNGTVKVQPCFHVYSFKVHHRLVHFVFIFWDFSIWQNFIKSLFYGYLTMWHLYCGTSKTRSLSCLLKSTWPSRSNPNSHPCFCRRFSSARKGECIEKHENNFSHSESLRLFCCWLFPHTTCDSRAKSSFNLTLTVNQIEIYELVGTGYQRLWISTEVTQGDGQSINKLPSLSLCLLTAAAVHKISGK